MKNPIPEHERAVWILKTRGPQSLATIAKEMDITNEGARFHLLKLEKDGLVKSSKEVKGRGRPKHIWSLTEKGHARFPDTHGDLTVKLITKMRETLGQEAVDQVIEANRESGIETYMQEMEGLEDLENKVAKLAEIRAREGYMAEYEKEDEGYLLIENHCPICSAAKACQGFCRAELETFRSVLGDDVSVERVNHIIAGARRCAYKIKQN